jgi:hypothetical protein
MKFGSFAPGTKETKFVYLLFGDKQDETETLVLATHRFIKKRDKMSATEIERAINIRSNIFRQR